MSTIVEARVNRCRQALLATPEGRHQFVVFLAQLEINQVAGMRQFIDGVLCCLAGQWDTEDRNARFEAVKEAIRAWGVPSTDVDDAVRALVEATP